MRRPSSKPTGPWRVPPKYKRLSFAEFVAARQRALHARRRGQPPHSWSTDPVLRHARFCNIDRRDDAVTVELLQALESAANWGLGERVMLSAALRFTGSRRGEAASLSSLIEQGCTKDHTVSPLCAALKNGEIKCGVGTYQMTLNRSQIASVIETMAGSVVERVSKDGPFEDVLDAADFVAERMTVGKRPQFSANETAKDFAYIPGLMQPSSHRRCRLGPGARKGLLLVRRLDDRLCKLADEAAVEQLRTELREEPSLAWVEAIDVEQALCEYMKYDTYVADGVSPGKRFLAPGAEMSCVEESLEESDGTSATGTNTRAGPCASSSTRSTTKKPSHNA